MRALTMDVPTANTEDHALIEMRDKTASETFRAKKRDTCSKVAARHLSAALHQGHVHANSIRGGGPPRVVSRPHRVLSLIVAVIVTVPLVIRFIGR